MKGRLVVGLIGLLLVAGIVVIQISLIVRLAQPATAPASAEPTAVALFPQMGEAFSGTAIHQEAGGDRGRRNPGLANVTLEATGTGGLPLRLQFSGQQVPLRAPSGAATGLLNGTVKLSDSAGTAWFEGEATSQLGSDGRPQLTLKLNGVGPYAGVTLDLQGAYSLVGSGASQQFSASLSGGMSGRPPGPVLGEEPVAQPQVDHTAWFAARAAGILGYLVLWVTVVLGIGVFTRGFRDRLARAGVFDLHRFLSLLGLGLIFGHVLLLLPDQYFQFWPDELFIPFLSPYRPIQVALGVFSLYLIGTLVASFWLRDWISYRLWRRLHYGTWVAFSLVLLHGILSGSDNGQPWLIALYTLTGASVLVLGGYRLAYRRRRRTTVLARSLGRPSPPGPLSRSAGEGESLTKA